MKPCKCGRSGACRECCCNWVDHHDAQKESCGLCGHSKYRYCLSPCRDIYAAYGKHEPNCRGGEIALLHDALAHVWGCASEPFACDHPDHQLAMALVAQAEAEPL